VCLNPTPLQTGGRVFDWSLNYVVL